MKVIMTFVTAKYAHEKQRFDLVTLFNKGEHFIDNENEDNSYSILK